jgi:hypothetical protein
LFGTPSPPERLHPELPSDHCAVRDTHMVATTDGDSR